MKRMQGMHSFLLCVGWTLLTHNPVGTHGETLDNAVALSMRTCPQPANDLQRLYEMVEDSGDLNIDMIDLAAFATGAFFAIRCPPQRGDAIVDAATSTGIYRPRKGAAGCDVFSYEVVDPAVSSSGDLRFRETRTIMVTIRGVNDPPEVEQNYFYNTPIYQLIPNLGNEPGYPRLRYRIFGVNQGGSLMQRMLLRMPPESGFDEDGEAIRYTITIPPSRGVVWIENDAGQNVCAGREACDGVGRVNWFSYLPSPGVNLTSDSFTYEVDDCSQPVLEGMSGNCTSGISVTIFLSIGAFTSGQLLSDEEEQATLIGPVSKYSNVAPLLVKEDQSVVGYVFHQSSGGVIADDLQFFVTNRPGLGSVKLFCDGQMVNLWSINTDPDTGERCENFQSQLNMTVVASGAGRVGAFRYTPDANLNGVDQFSFTTFSRTFLNGTRSGVTSTVFIEVVSVNDIPEIVPFERTLVTIFTIGDKRISGNIQVPMLEVGKTNYGLVTVQARDQEAITGSQQLYTRLVASFTRGKLYQNISEETDEPFDLVELSESIIMNSPDLTARSDTYTLSLYYVANDPLLFGAPYDSGTFLVTDDPGSTTEFSNRSTAFLQVQCARGHHIVGNPAAADGQCVPCEEGTFNTFLGAGACDKCNPGSFSLGGGIDCTLCAPHSWQDAFGSTGCVNCPLNRDTMIGLSSLTGGLGSKKRQDCFCERADPAAVDFSDERKRGFYGPHGEPCHTCPGPKNPTGDNEWVKCDVNGLVFPVSKGGFFVDTKALPVIVRECIPKEACPEHVTEQAMLDTPCIGGYTGHGCSQCDAGYSRYFGKCMECDHNLPKSFYFFGFYVALPVFFVFSTYYLSSSLKSHPEYKIFLNYVQILGVFARYKAKWPTFLGKILRFMTFTLASPDLMKPACLSDSWEYKDSWLIVEATPLMFVGLVVVSTVFIFAHREFTRRKGEEMRERFPQFFQKRKKGATFWEKQEHKLYRFIGLFLTKAMDHDESVALLRRQIHATITFVNVAYTFLVLKFFEFIECSENAADGNWYLVAEPSYQCYQFSYDSNWGKMFPVAVAVGIFYVIGFPLLVCYVMYSIRDNKSNSAQFRTVGSLYTRYDHTWYAWELQILIFKCLMAASLFLFSTNTDINILKQTIYAQAVIIGMVFLHSYAGPYDNWVLNSYQTLCQFCLFIIIFCGQAFSGNISEALRDKLDAWSIFVVMIPIVIFVTSKVDLLYSFYLSLRGEKTESLRAQMGLSLFETVQAEKGFGAKSTEARRGYFDKYLRVHENDDVFVSEKGIRATKDLWWRQRALSEATGIPTKEDLKPVFDHFFTELEQVALEHLSGEPEKPEFQEFLNAQHMMLQVLAQNNVEENNFFRETLQSVVDFEPKSSFFAKCANGLLDRFQADIPRHGSTYTNYIARFEEYKAKEAKLEEDRAMKAFRAQSSRTLSQEFPVSPRAMGGGETGNSPPATPHRREQYDLERTLKEERFAQKATVLLTPAQARVDMEAREVYRQKLIEKRTATVSLSRASSNTVSTEYGENNRI